MKKILPYILIFVILLQLFAPFSVGVNDKKIEINQNIKKAEAADDWDGTINGYKNAFPKSSLVQNSSVYLNEEQTQSGITVRIDTGIPEGESSQNRWLHVKPEKSKVGAFFKNLFDFSDSAYNEFEKDNTFILKVVQNNTKKSGFRDITNEILAGYGHKRISPDANEDGMFNAITKPLTLTTLTPSDSDGITSLAPGTNYSIYLYYLSAIEYGDPDFIKGTGEIIKGLESNGSNYIQIASAPLTTATKGQSITTTGIVDEASTIAGQQKQGDLPACDILGVKGDFMGCIAQGIYYLFFKTTSFVFGLTGKILDFTLMYSIDDNSYRSTFVVEGWGIIRDFCNMFFIFVLLYIAFGTILNLNGVKTKEMIVNVVIIGLLINFSLFTTRFIIDASNILTRVFYNQNTITTGTQKDSSDNVISELGEFGEIKLSEAIVSKVDPQKLIMEAKKLESIPIRGQANNENQNRTAEGITTGSFILVILLATAVNIVGIVAFLSSALVFIGRVVMLWMAMILSPLAFFSYTVPFLQGIKMVGWKNWWSDTLSIAFVAPVFAFFMYIIVSFLSKGLGMIDASLKDGYIGLSFAVAMIVPFVFIMVLLMKAKSVAVSMSGEVGSMLSKAGGAVAGLALGAATGGTAMLGRATIGNMGNKLANSKWASTHGAVGRGFQNVGKWAGSSSFDARSTKLGQKAGSGLGVDLGKAKSGGFTKHLEEKTAKKVKRAEELKVHEEEPLKQALNKTEMDLQSLLSENKAELDGIDKAIEKARNSLKDSKDTGNTHDQSIYSSQLEAFKKQRDALINGKDMRGMGITYLEDNGAGGFNTKNIDADYEHGGLDSSGVVHKSTRISDGSGAMLSITDLEKKQRIGKEKIEEENRKRTTSYAKGLWTSMSSANREAEHKIIMGSKIESGQK